MEYYRFVLQIEVRKPGSFRSVLFLFKGSKAYQGLLCFSTSLGEKKSNSVKNVIGNFKAISLNL